MHDTKDVSNSSEALKDSIDYLKSAGYTFENFYDMGFIKYNKYISEICLNSY